MNTTPAWLTVRQAAEYTGLHAETIRTLMRRGDIEARKPGKTWRTTRQWLDQYMNEGAA